MGLGGGVLAAGAAGLLLQGDDFFGSSYSAFAASYTAGAAAGIVLVNRKFGNPRIASTLLGVGLGATPLFLGIAINERTRDIIVPGLLAGVAIITVPAGGALASRKSH